MFPRNLKLLVVMGICTISFTMMVTGAGAVGPNDIKWNKPLSIAERITGKGPVEVIPAEYDDYGVKLSGKKGMLKGYILPEGWKEAVGDVKKLVLTNSGALAGDPATALNAKIFEKMTGIHLEFIEMSGALMWPKQLSVLVARSTDVDLFYQRNPMLEIPHLSAANWAVPVDELWTPDVEKLYPEKVLDSFKGIDGRFYGGAPFCFWAMHLFYRPSWLTKAGVTVPLTWQDLVIASSKVDTWAENNLGPGNDGMVYAAGDPDLVHVLLAMVQYSQDKPLIKDGRFVIDPDTWKIVTDLWLKGGMSDSSLEYLWSMAPEVFAKGKAGFTITGGVYINEFKNPEFATGIQNDWGVTLTPGWEGIGNRGIGPVQADDWTINPYISPAKKAAAMLWMDYQRSYQAQFNELYVEGNESAMMCVYEHPAVKNEVAYVDLRRETLEAQIGESYPPAMWEAIEMVKEYLGRVVLGEMDPDKALEQVQAEINMIM